MSVVSIVVLYRPDSETVEFVRKFSSSGNRVVAVWNEFESIIENPFKDDSFVTLVANERNIGLAKALNVGIETARDYGADFFLLLDQDSRPDSDLPQKLMTSRDQAVRDGLSVALTGPTLRDRKADGDVNSRNRRGGAEYEVVRGLSTSGSLVDRRALDLVGPMWESLFIDGIDHEWCFRAQSRNFCIIRSSVEMLHDMGDSGVNFLGRYKPIHRSPFRHYYIVRNAIWLVRLPHVPWDFSLSEMAKMLYRIPIYLIVSSSRRQSIISIVKGLSDGLSAKIRRFW